MRLEEMKNNIPETPDFIHKMVQEEVSRQLQDTKVVPMKKRKWNKVQAAAAAALCLLATSTVAYAGNRLYHMYVEKQGTYRVETGIQADGGTSVQLPDRDFSGCNRNTDRFGWNRSYREQTEPGR